MVVKQCIAVGLGRRHNEFTIELFERTSHMSPLLDTHLESLRSRAPLPVDRPSTSDPASAERTVTYATSIM